jgi:hypothetical protein
MSNSIAAAKKRRAGIQPTTPQQPTPIQSQSAETSSMNSPKLTLPQVIAVIDNRLINLEQFMKEIKENGEQLQQLQQFASEDSENIEVNDSSEVIKVPIAEYVVEMDKKFELLVEEISELKDIVLKLQSFTMEVNKTLMEDRIQILSDYKNIQIDNTEQSESVDLNAETFEISQSMVNNNI